MISWMFFVILMAHLQNHESPQDDEKSAFDAGGYFADFTEVCTKDLRHQEGRRLHVLEFLLTQFIFRFPGDRYTTGKGVHRTCRRNQGHFCLCRMMIFLCRWTFCLSIRHISSYVVAYCIALVNHNHKYRFVGQVNLNNLDLGLCLKDT